MRSAGQTISPFCSGIAGIGVSGSYSPSVLFPGGFVSINPLRATTNIWVRGDCNAQLDTMRDAHFISPVDVVITEPDVLHSAFFGSPSSNAPGGTLPPTSSFPPGFGVPPPPHSGKKFLARTKTPEGELSLLSEAMQGTPDGLAWMELVRLGRAGYASFKELADRPLVKVLANMSAGVLAPRPDNFTSEERTPWGGKRILKYIKADLEIPNKPKIVGESWEISGHSSFPNLFPFQYADRQAEISLNVLGMMFPENMYGQHGFERHGMNMPFLVKLLNSGSWKPYIDQLVPIMVFLDRQPQAASWRKSMNVDESLKEILRKDHHEVHRGLTRLWNNALRDILVESNRHPMAANWRRTLNVRALEDILERDPRMIKRDLARLISIQKAAGYSVGADALANIQKLRELHRKMLSKNLSVQVHPTSSYGGLQPDEHSKTEAWIIEHAEPGAGIYLGLKDEVTKDQFRSALKRGEDVTGLLNFVPVNAGDVFFIPAGTMHAVGAGVLLVEPQETSETTYRVYDYGRVGDRGRPRQLHVDSAIAVTNWDGPRGEKAVASFRRTPSRIIQAKGKNPALVENLLSESVFESRRITFGEGEQYAGISERAIQGFVVMKGKVAVYAEDGENLLGEFSKGESFIIPVGMGNFTLKGMTKSSIAICTTATLPHGLGVAKPTTSVSTIISSQSLEIQTRNRAFVESRRPHILMINTQGYAGSKVPMGATDSGGQLTYIGKKAEALVKMGYKVTIVTRACTHEIDREGNRFQYDIEEFGDRKGAAFAANNLVRYVYVPGVQAEDAPFIPKEQLYPDLPAIARNLAQFIEDEASDRGIEPWNYFRFVDTHYIDAGIVGQRLIRIWQHELTKRHLKDCFVEVLGEDFDMDAFDSDNLMGNIQYHFGKRIIEAWTAEMEGDARSFLDGPSVNEEAVLRWAGQKLCWSETRIARLVANLQSSDGNLTTPVEDSAFTIGYRLLEEGGDTPALQERLQRINRHSFTPHSLGKLKEERMIEAGEIRDDPDNFLSMNFETREQAERAILSGAVGGFDHSTSLFANLPPAPIIGITSNEILESAYKLGMPVSKFTLRFEPGTDMKRYYPHHSVDDPDVQALFRGMVDRKVVPADFVDKLLQRPQDFNIVVEAGRMDYTKRKHILIEAMKYLPENTILFITGKQDGKGVYKGLAKKIEEMGLGRRVFLLGYVEDELMGPLMGLPHGNDERQFRLGIIASASRMEGWGMAVQDGTAGGLPLVASSFTPYAMHLARTNKAAMIIKVGTEDEPRQYARAIKGLIDNPPAARDLARRGRKIAQQYEWQSLTERFETQVNGLFFSGASVYPGAMETAATRSEEQSANPPLHVVILGGGRGTRFRPYSTDELPKQFLPVTERDRSMIQVTAGRFLDAADGDRVKVPPENIWVSTNDRYAELAAEQLPAISKDNIVGEPEQRNTAPAIATLMYRIAAKDPNAAAIIVPSNHYLASTENFLEQVAEAVDFALESGGLVTFGIPPTWPSPDYGYIERGRMIDTDANHQDGIYSVKRFVEKPSTEIAQRYLERGNFLWNSGMFVWTARDFLRHLAAHQPLMYAGLEAVYGSVANGAPLTADVMRQFFGPLNPISIDYALMEPASKSRSVYVLPLRTEWSDVGTWQGLKRLVDEGRIQPPERALRIMEAQLAAN